MLGSKSLPSTSVLQVSLTVSEMSRSSVRPIMSLISNLRSLSSRLSWVVAEGNTRYVRQGLRLENFHLESFVRLEKMQHLKSIYLFSCSQHTEIYTDPVHAPKAVEPPPRCSPTVRLPAQKQTLPPGPERTQSSTDWTGLWRKKMNKNNTQDISW